MGREGGGVHLWGHGGLLWDRRVLYRRAANGDGEVRRNDQVHDGEEGKVCGDQLENASEDAHGALQGSPEEYEMMSESEVVVEERFLRA